MTFRQVMLQRRSDTPAIDTDVWWTIWEATIPENGYLNVTVQAQAVDKELSPINGVVRIRIANTGQVGADTPVFGLDGHLDLPELEVQAGQLVEVQARPSDAGQVYVEMAAASVSSVSLEIPGSTGNPPVNISVPVVSGVPLVGEELSVTDGTWTGDPDPTITYQWTNDGVDISGETDPTYTVVSGDIGDDIGCDVTATNLQGSATVSTNTLTITAGDQSIEIGSYVTPATATSQSITKAQLAPDLADGDSVLFLIAAVGPAGAATVTYNHPAGTTVVDFAGNQWQPRLKAVWVPYDGESAWAFSANQAIRVGAVALRNTQAVTAGSVVNSATPVNPTSETCTDDSLGLAVTVLNWTNGTLTAPPASHTLLEYTGPGDRQMQIAKLALSAAGVYDPAAATYTAGTGGLAEQGTAVAIVAHPDPVSTPPTGVYMWEDRPPYVEPNPNAAGGSAEKAKADELGITHRVSVSTASALIAAVAAAPAAGGRQVYLTSTIVGNGSSSLLNIIGNTSGTGARTGGVVQGGGSHPDGTLANPNMLTCAPGVWIDGGLTHGVSNSNSRCIQIRGMRAWWLYGANFQRAQFPVKFDQCPGDGSNPIRMWYCQVRYAGNALVQFGGYFDSVNPSTGATLSSASGGKYGHSRHIDCRYNEVSYAGLANDEFGEGIYVGQGSSLSYTAIRCHDIHIEGNYLHHLTAEANEMKIGTYDSSFNYNLIADCSDDNSFTGFNGTARTGNTAIGFPGGVHFWPPFGTYDATAGTNPNLEAIGNRWLRCTSGAQKFPSAQLLLAHRGMRAIGNLFDGCTVPSSPQIRVYVLGSHQMGTAGTIEVHNNTSDDARTLLDFQNAGASNPTQLTNAQDNTNASNNVGTSSQTGVDQVVTGAAFTSDGTGYEGSGFAVAPAGALDVTGADTSSLWDEDYAGVAVAAPVNPGARQI